MDASEFDSSPLVGLTFARVERVTKTGRTNQSRRRKYPGNLLNLFHRRNAKLCYLVLGSREEKSFYLGVSAPKAVSHKAAFEETKSILQSIYDKVYLFDRPFSSQEVKNYLSPLCIHTGIVTGCPALRPAGVIDSNQLDRLTSRLRGKEFGLMIVAVPLAENNITQESVELDDKRDDSTQDLVAHYSGMWQVCVYFFAEDRSVFTRMQSLIHTVFASENELQPLVIQEITNLRNHIERFGLLKQRHLRVADKIHATPTLLRSRFLSAFISPPKEDIQPQTDIFAGLRRYDLHELENEGIDAADLISWPVPGLTFVRIDGVKANESTNQRSYLMENALIGLHASNANICFLTVGGKRGVSFFMGTSLPSSQTDSFDAIQSLLHSTHSGIETLDTPVSSAEISALIAPLCTHTGVTTGFPALTLNDGETMGSAQLERLANGLSAHDFGMMVLAVPIPNAKVNQEEFVIEDQMQKAQENEDPANKRRIKCFLELQNAYLNHIRLGTSVGMWLVGVYYFAPDRSVFVRLQSLIRATYVDETSRPTPLRTHEIENLKSHIEQFGLMRNKNPSTHLLTEYMLLTPLNSRVLSAFVHLPRRNMPGFRVW